MNLTIKSLTASKRPITAVKQLITMALSILRDTTVVVRLTGQSNTWPGYLKMCRIEGPWQMEPDGTRWNQMEPDGTRWNATSELLIRA